MSTSSVAPVNDSLGIVAPRVQNKYINKPKFGFDQQPRHVTIAPVEPSDAAKAAVEVIKHTPTLQSSSQISPPRHVHHAPLSRPPYDHCWITELDVQYFKTIIDMPTMCLYELARRFAEVVLDDADAHPRISFAPVASVVSLDSLSSVAQAATAAQSAASTNQNAGSAPTWAPQLVPVAEEEHKNLGPPNDENVMTRGLINLEQFLQILDWTSWEQIFIGTQIFRVFLGASETRAVMNFQKFLTVLSMCSKRTNLKVKIPFAFRLFDQDGNGVLDWRELNVLLRVTMLSNSIVLTAQQLDELCHNTMKAHGVHPSTLQSDVLVTRVSLTRERDPKTGLAPQPLPQRRQTTSELPEHPTTVTDLLAALHDTDMPERVMLESSFTHLCDVFPQMMVPFRLELPELYAWNASRCGRRRKRAMERVHIPPPEPVKPPPVIQSEPLSEMELAALQAVRQAERDAAEARKRDEEAELAKQTSLHIDTAEELEDGVTGQDDEAAVEVVDGVASPKPLNRRKTIATNNGEVKRPARLNTDSRPGTQSDTRPGTAIDSTTGSPSNADGGVYGVISLKKAPTMVNLSGDELVDDEGGDDDDEDVEGEHEIGAGGAAPGKLKRRKSSKKKETTQFNLSPSRRSKVCSTCSPEKAHSPRPYHEGSTRVGQRRCDGRHGTPNAPFETPGYIYTTDVPAPQPVNAAKSLSPHAVRESAPFMHGSSVGFGRPAPARGVSMAVVSLLGNDDVRTNQIAAPALPSNTAVANDFFDRFMAALAQQHGHAAVAAAVAQQLSNLSVGEPLVEPSRTIKHAEVKTEKVRQAAVIDLQLPTTVIAQPRSSSPLNVTQSNEPMRVDVRSTPQLSRSASPDPELASAAMSLLVEQQQQQTSKFLTVETTHKSANVLQSPKHIDTISQIDSRFALLSPTVPRSSTPASALAVALPHSLHPLTLAAASLSAAYAVDTKIASGASAFVHNETIEIADLHAHLMQRLDQKKGKKRHVSSPQVDPSIGHTKSAGSLPMIMSPKSKAAVTEVPRSPQPVHLPSINKHGSEQRRK